ncbi:MAG: phenylalanine--tRNA ligase subunit beta [Candidatus Poseidoniales archaeon]|uniref:phenylalanine--tRNA ligase n=1 Tax=uncultured Poseidoniia archaeon TaxID=1697135 RepID=A0A1B1TDT6_9ARCH|nr:phenylalanyl-tRNA synthetase subunit beta (FARSB, pheT) [uncultured Candidatus Thalassoarchaea sp.]MDC0155642.1 phenylalanine--tRNA ligase subunit beta [Euryarchaeota archaeon]RCH72865.1 MAG: phenylalanine--tRNA ligase subunit beta [Candidatus Poseidoniales archaeon]
MAWKLGDIMPTLKFNHNILEYLHEINGVKYDSNDWEKRMPSIGCVVEENDEEGIEIEIFPDRTDLLSHETISRAARAFLNSLNDSPNLDIKQGEITLEVDKSLQNLRPVILGAVVRGVDNGTNYREKDDFIQSLMDHQEKLHLTLGRKRKFASIGVHDLSQLSPPFKVISVDKKYKFTPLAEEKEMSIEDILKSHPKGKEYAHLMSELKEYPVIIDAEDRVLSFPPIINGDHTTVNEQTRDFFIDVTGWDERSCEACLLLICLSLAERGGVIESIQIKNWDQELLNVPRGDSKSHKVPDRLIRNILGIELSKTEIADSIKKMGGELIETRTVTNGPDKIEKWADCIVGEKEHVISMPRWRNDIMHPVDIVEDIAIGYGYDNLPEQLSAVHLDAIPLPSSNLKRRISSSLCALGLQETQSLTLSNKRDQFERVRWIEENKSTIISNPITKEHTMLRQYILPSLLNLLAANRHHELPQRVHELGDVVRDSENKTRLSWACAEVGGGFSAAKGIASSLLRDLGANLSEVKWQGINQEEGPWIKGRGAKVIIGGIEVGQIGEIDPKVSFEFGLKVPIQAGEFDVDALGRTIPDPVL